MSRAAEPPAFRYQPTNLRLDPLTNVIYAIEPVQQQPSAPALPSSAVASQAPASAPPPKPRTIVVLAAQPLSASRRAQLHARELSGFFPSDQVRLIGYPEKSLIQELSTSENFKTRLVDSNDGVWWWLTGLVALLRLPWIVAAPIHACVRMIYQLFQLMQADGTMILLENPPSFPTLLVVRLVRLLRKPQVVCDWREASPARLERDGHWSRLVRLAERFELYWMAHTIDYHIVATQALMDLVRSELDVSPDCVVLLRDRPTKRLADCPERGETLKSLETVLSSAQIEGISNEKLRLVVGSSSWSTQGHVGRWLEALSQMESECREARGVVAVLTGRGPYLSTFQNLVQEKKFENIQVVPVWISDIETLSALRRCADFGVFLEALPATSRGRPSSVAETLTEGTPMILWRFPAVSELVSEFGKESCFVVETMPEFALEFSELASLRGQQLVRARTRLADRLEATRLWSEEWRASLGEALTRLVNVNGTETRRRLAAEAQTIFVWRLICIVGGLVAIVYFAATGPDLHLPSSERRLYGNPAKRNEW